MIMDSRWTSLIEPHRAESDQKLDFLVNNYGDQHMIFTAPEEVEHMRSRAKRFGYFTTIAAFAFNEFARLTMRSRKSNSLQLTRSSSPQSDKTELFVLGSRPFHLLQTNG